jgi:hypothetical protein
LDIQGKMVLDNFLGYGVHYFGSLHIRYDNIGYAANPKGGCHRSFGRLLGSRRSLQGLEEGEA